MNSIKDNVTRRSVGRPKKIITEKPIHKKVGRPPNPVKIISEEEQKNYQKQNDYVHCVMELMN